MLKEELFTDDFFKEFKTGAHSIMADPAMWTLSETSTHRKRRSTYRVAFRDAYHGPQIRSITADFYTGEAGESILERAIDNFKVAAVQVTF